MSTETKQHELQETGRTAYAAIKEMVDALECDYDALDSLRELADGDRTKLYPEQLEELEELEGLAGDCESEDDARERIEEDPLELAVRGDWHAPGQQAELAEYRLLLTTGGPAVRIVGDLEDGEPTSASLEVQDWFTPWTEYQDADQDVLLAYARCFYFGEE